jgi:hypothetical protein
MTLFCCVVTRLFCVMTRLFFVMARLFFVMARRVRATRGDRSRLAVL